MLLRRLAACSGCHLAVISGRSLADVQMHVGVPGIYYVGNHGLELSGPGIALHSHCASKAHGELERLLAFLVEKTASWQGIFIENKGVSASIHWRLASQENRENLCELITGTIPSYPRLRLAAGKCVWEVRPKNGWNKGDALTHLIGRTRIEAEDVLYLGDDVTDEDAFRAGGKGLTFHVGEKYDSTAAQYRIRDTADVQAFLLCVLGVRSRTSGANAEFAPEDRQMAFLESADSAVFGV